MLLDERGIYGGYGFEGKPFVAPYTYPEGASKAIINIAVALSVVATVCLSLRVYARLFVLNHRTTGWSLWLAILAWAFSIPTSALFALSAQYGLGQHFDVAKLNPNINQALLYEWIAVALGMFATWFGKASALVYILDVQGPTHRNWRWLLIGLVGINLLLYLIMFPLVFLQCSPAPTLWNIHLDGECNNGKKVFIIATISGTWGAFTDLVLACYPALLISALQIKLRLKIGLSLLLGLGAFTSACAIVKTMLFCAFQATADQTYDNAGFVYWSIAEMWVILIVGSVPPLWPIGKRVGSRWSHMVSSGDARRSGSQGILASWKKGKGGGGKAFDGERSGSSSDAVTLTALSTGNGDTGIYASQVGPEEEESRSAARRYFYEYGTDCASRKAAGSAAVPPSKVATRKQQPSDRERLRNSPFGEWGVIVTRSHSTEALTLDDGILVTKDVSVTTEASDGCDRDTPAATQPSTGS